MNLYTSACLHCVEGFSLMMCQLFFSTKFGWQKIKFLHYDILSESTYLGEVNEFGKMRRFFKSYRDNLSAEDRLYLELSE